MLRTPASNPACGTRGLKPRSRICLPSYHRLSPRCTRSGLLCHDGSDATVRAVRRGAELAISMKAEVFVLSMVSSGFSNPEFAASCAGTACLHPEDSSNRLEQSLSWLKTRGVSAQGLLGPGNSIDQIVNHARHLAIDLIVLGHYPQPSGGFWWSSPQRGSLAERAGCCVLVAVQDDAIETVSDAAWIA
jgi:nucleotide-binding universal stress UspA family protein